MKKNKSMNNKMKVEVWSDIMCPFCYIGKRHYEEALKNFHGRDQVEIEWKSFQLDPSIPEIIKEPVSVYQYLADSKGMSLQNSVKMHDRVNEMARNAGLKYNMDKAVVANSFKAHRIIQLSKSKGLGDKAEEVFFNAYFIQGKNLGNTEELISLGKEIGLTENEVNDALQDDQFAYEVNQDIREAASIGVRGVPFFLFNGKYAISGAQPVEVFANTLEESFSGWSKENPVSNIDWSPGSSCTTDGKCD